MTRPEIEALKNCLTSYLERQDDKDGLAIVCQMACALADQIERDVGNLADPDITRWMQ